MSQLHDSDTYRLTLDKTRDAFYLSFELMLALSAVQHLTQLIPSYTQRFPAAWASKKIYILILYICVYIA